MELKRPNSVCKRLLLSGLTLCVVLVSRPSSAIGIYADPEVTLQNGTTGVLRCSFTSSVPVNSTTTVTWSFQSSQPESPSYRAPYVIFYFSQWKGYPGQAEFSDRVQFIGDISKRDVSIQLSPVQFTDNGTFLCDVKNPPDVTGTPARTELRVVAQGADTFPTVIVGAACGAGVLLLLIAIAACVILKAMHNRHDYEGCETLESMSSQAPQPRKKVESNLEGTKGTVPSGPLQGPVIYAQLDHSGSKNSFHKMEPVVYADIRKN